MANGTGSRIPHVAIVGRPNVGKSSLFNRIVKKRQAIVYQEMGTTRDRNSKEVEYEGKRFILTDTGGFMLEDADNMFKLVKEQIKTAINESDVLLFVCDGQEGLTAQDLELAKVIRKANKPIFLAINKADNEKISERALDFYQMGIEKPYPVSALHNRGVGDLMEDLVKKLPLADIREKGAESAMKIAIVGRPNVGKSSFVNALLKEERVIVDETPGTTRDTVDTYLKDGNREFILIDTAGLRHKRKVKEAVDVYSIMRTKEAIKRSDVCLVLIDGYQGITVDDLKIINTVMDEGKCCVICVNKWDLIKGLTAVQYKEMIYGRAGFLKKYPVLFTSAKTKYNVYNSLDTVMEIIKNANLRVPTKNLNKLFEYMKSTKEFCGRRSNVKLYYATQTGVMPPTFLIFVNNPKSVSEEQRNVMENLLKKNFGFFGTPLKFEFRSSKGKNR